MAHGAGPLTPDVACHDAVVIVPGIMGSELREAATNAFPGEHLAVGGEDGLVVVELYPRILFAEPG